MLPALVTVGLLLPAAIAVVAAARRPSSERAIRTALRVVASLAEAVILFGFGANLSGNQTQGPCAAPAPANAVAAAIVYLALRHVAAVRRMVPAFSPFACALGAFTACRAWSVLQMVVACHGRVKSDDAVRYWIYLALLCAVLLVRIAQAFREDEDGDD